MKQLKQICLLPIIFFSVNIFASNPVQGFYGGLMGTVSHGPSTSTVNFSEVITNTPVQFTGTASYGVLGGGGGAFFGYKYSHFRAEANILYNRISTGPLKVGTCTLESPNVLTPTGVCPAIIESQMVGYSGSNDAVFGLFTGYWDFYNPESDNPVFPYVGLGFGLASIKNSSSFVDTASAQTSTDSYTTYFSQGGNTQGNGPAIQGVLGLSYYMDDFTWASIDYRLMYTKYSQTANNADGNLIVINTGSSATDSKSGFTLNAINFTISFAFDKGGIS